MALSSFCGFYFNNLNFLSKAFDFCLELPLERAEIKLMYNILNAPIYPNPWRQIKTEIEPIIHSLKFKFPIILIKAPQTKQASRKGYSVSKYCWLCFLGGKAGWNILSKSQMQMRCIASQSLCLFSRASAPWAEPGTSLR